VNPSSGADHGAPADRGVLTAADAHYFPGLLGLHASVQASGAYPVLCYDLGLTDEQRAEATRCANLQVLELPPDPLIEELRQAARGDPAPQKPGKRTWAIWICPLLIRAAPLHDVVWLDCDMLVLRGLEELFAMLDDGPVFTPETHAPALTPNDPELYRLLPIARSFDPGQPTVNGGVSAWRRGRDDHALDAYIRPVAAAARSSAVRQAIAWWDQGALIWAIQALGLQHRVLASAAWNLPIGRTGVPAEMLIWDDGLLGRLQAALPEVMILHWNGRPVPWS
jgi:hypothetical protein